MLSELFDDEHWVLVLVDADLLCSFTVEFDLEGTDKIAWVLLLWNGDILSSWSLLRVDGHRNWLVVLNVI